MRRALDLAGAVVAGLVLLPLMLVVAAVVALSMGRPLLFRQERSGRHGEIFRVLKFRTMRPPAPGAESDAERTPAVGAILRSTSLDELPQLWNILRGEMAFIGPRPTLPEQVALYTPRERGRLAVRPGLTGWAQVNGRNAISWPERIELDLWYIANRSWALDARIAARTVGRVLGRSGVVGAGGVNPGFPERLAAEAAE